MKRLLFVCAALVFGFYGCALYAPRGIQSDERMERLSKPLPYLAQVFSYVTETSQFGPLPIPERIPTRGSAFVYRDEKGRCGVYTSNHTIDMTEKTAWVRIDGEKTAVEVPVMSRDSFFDIAVLACPQLSGMQIGSAVLGSQDDVSVGRQIFTVGFPYGRRSVTTGYVTSVTGPAEVAPYLFSHQGPVQPGDSGGISVVFDDRDEPIVVGMTATMAISGLRSYPISIRYLPRIMARLWEKAPGVHVAFGASMADVSGIHPGDYADGTGKPYPPPGTVVVVGVQDETSAGSAGLMSGDAIVGARRSDGTKIPFATAGELLIEIFFQATDETIFLSVIRDGKPLEAAVTLRAKKKEQEVETK